MFMFIPPYHARIDQATKDKLKNVSTETLELAHKVESLQNHIDRMGLVTQALWEVLQKRTGITEEEFSSLIEEIDLRDGKRDGRITPTPKKCTKCQRTVSTRTNMCLYCGNQEYW